MSTESKATDASAPTTAVEDKVTATKAEAEGDENEEDEEEDAEEDGPGLAALIGDDLPEEEEADADFNASEVKENDEEGDITLPDDEEVPGEETEDLKRDAGEDAEVSGPRTKRARVD